MFGSRLDSCSERAPHDAIVSAMLKISRIMSAALVLLAVMLVVFFLPTPGQQAWEQVEVLRYDWHGSGKPFTFILDVPKNWNVGGDFSRLRIQLKGGRVFVLQNKDGWTKLDEQDVATQLLRKNLVQSRHLLFVPDGSDPRKPPLLFLFGWPYGSSPGSLHALRLEEGTPRVIFFRKEYSLTDFTDLNGDGIPEIVGKKCLSQEWGSGFLTYDPFTVYTLPRRGAKSAQLSIPLSKQYNLQHYYGWAGPNCSEEIAIVLHPPKGGKPFIMKAREAEKLFEVKQSPKP